MSEEEKIALFDAYLRNELSVEDRAGFKTLLDKNEDFKKDFDAYQSTAHEIKEGQEYGLIKETLKEIHAEHIQPKKSILLRAKFIIPIVSAAAILVLLITVFPFNENGDTAQAENVSADDYSPTDNEEEAGEGEAFYEEATEVQEMDSIIHENYADTNNENNNSVDFLNKVIEYTQSVPLGTSFQISKKGYFITAKHLVYKKRYVQLHNKEQQLAFYAEVIYRDTLADFAVLKCSDSIANLLNPCPYKIRSKQPNLGDEVFTLGYPKAEIVYTKGAVSSSKGYRSDSLTFELSLPSNSGNSGAPLFSKSGNFMGLIVANNSKKQSVTYVVQPTYIAERIQQLRSKYDIDMSKNYSKNSQKPSYLIEKFTPFIFELK